MSEAGLDDATRRVKLHSDRPATIEIVRADTIVPEAVGWLWPGWLACGKFHLMAGAPGTGKTTLAIAIGATITTAGVFPDGFRPPSGSVLIWSGEDDLADSIVPRFMANGGNRSLLNFVGGSTDENGSRRPFDPATDFHALAAAAAKIPDLRLLVVDPVVSAVAGDSHKNAEVRRGLQPLVDFAGKTGAAVLGISHFTKATSGRDPVDRVTGSLAFGALPRLVMVTAKPVEQGGHRRLVRAKSNIGPDGNGFEYNLLQLSLEGASGIFGQAVAWGRVLEGTARELLAAVETEENEAEAPARADAERWLVALLDNGPVDAKEIARLAKTTDRSMRTVERAKARLGIESIKIALTGGWSWALPRDAAKEGCHTSVVAAFDKTAVSTEGRHGERVASFGGVGALRGTEVEVEI